MCNDPEIFGLLSEYACTRVKCGWGSSSNKILIVLIRILIKRDKLFALIFSKLN